MSNRLKVRGYLEKLDLSNKEAYLKHENSEGRAFHNLSYLTFKSFYDPPPLYFSAWRLVLSKTKDILC